MPEKLGSLPIAFSYFFMPPFLDVLFLWHPSKKQMCKCEDVQMCKCEDVQISKCADVQMCRCEDV